NEPRQVEAGFAIAVAAEVDARQDDLSMPLLPLRRISPRTASARRLRVAPRTSGMTQKLQEKLQPSCTFTNARTRSRRASAWTQPIAPTSPATNSGVSSLGRATTVTLAGIPAKASPLRLAPQPVTYTRAFVRAARETACRGVPA